MMEGIGGVSGGHASYGTNASAGVSVKDLQKQYPGLKISAQSFGSESAIRSYAMKQTGKYNVAIDPRALSRMDGDGEFADKIHSALSGVKDWDDQLERHVQGRGADLIASGTIIDKDGNVGSWSVSQTSSSSGKGNGVFAMAKGDSLQDVLKALEEKRMKKQEEEKRLEKRRELEESMKITGTAAPDSSAAPDDTGASGSLDVLG